MTQPDQDPPDQDPAEQDRPKQEQPLPAYPPQPQYQQPQYPQPQYPQAQYPQAQYPQAPYAPHPQYPPSPLQGYPSYPPVHHWQQSPTAWGAPHPPRPPFPHPEPRDYHLMYRTWSYSWWRPLVGILLLGAGMLIVMPLLALPVLVVGVVIEGGDRDFFEAMVNAGTFQELTPSGLLYLNVTLGGLILWTWGLVRVLHSMRPRWLSSVVPKLRWGFLLICLGLSVLALVAQLLVGALVPQDANPDVALEPNAITGTTLAMAVIVLFTTPLQAAGEEYAFRGYLLQAVGSLSGRRWVALLVTATLFAIAHGFQNPPLFFDRFMFGLIAGWLVIRTGGLEAAIAMHVLNNYLAFGLALAFGDIDEALTVSEISWWNVPVTLTQSVVYAALVAWVAARQRLQRQTRPPTPTPLL